VNAAALRGTQLAVRVDVDTRHGLRTGVPRLLGIFERRGVRASFFVAMGPDRWGRAILRAPFERGFLAKLWRTRGLAGYGLGTLLNGTLRPGPATGAGQPGLLREIEAAGHEVEPHGWDHLAWQMQLDSRGAEWLRGQFSRACDAYAAIFGRRPAGWASPSWRCNPETLALADEAGLAYSADTRGAAPFQIRCGDRQFRTVQIPTTLPVTEEIVGLDGVDAADYNDFLVQRLKPGALNVYTVHAEVEGGPFADRFEDLLGLLAWRGVEYLRHDQLARELAGASLPVCAVERRGLPGRSLAVSCQVESDPGPVKATAWPARP
jgi:undecaprenyl phosphate-alpha-L-ara4FN deformylase